MLKIKDVLFEYILRMPFFLLVYVITFIITRDSIIFFPLFAVFLGIGLLEAVIKRRLIVVLICVLLCAVFAFLQMPALAVTAALIVFYRSAVYNGFYDAVWIACMLAAAAVIEYAVDPAFVYIGIRCVLMAAIFSVLGRQMQTLNRFLGSYYCRTTSRRTAKAAVIRSYMLTLLGLAAVITAGFVIRPSEPIISLSNIPDNRAETVMEIVHEWFGQERADYPGAESAELEPVIPREVIPPQEHEPTRAPLIPAIIASVIAAAFLVLVVIGFIHRRSETAFDDYDEDEEVNAAVIGTKPKKRAGLFKFGANNAVRKMFRLKVRENIIAERLKPRKSDTPQDLAYIISEWEDIGALRRLYHKARYSGETVKRAELGLLQTEMKKKY
jgi:hypothetical protein